MTSQVTTFLPRSKVCVRRYQWWFYLLLVLTCIPWQCLILLEALRNSAWRKLAATVLGPSAPVYIRLLINKLQTKLQVTVYKYLVREEFLMSAHFSPGKIGVRIVISSSDTGVVNTTPSLRIFLACTIIRISFKSKPPLASNVFTGLNGIASDDDFIIKCEL